MHVFDTPRSSSVRRILHVVAEYDTRTFEHCMRVARLSVAIGEVLQPDAADRQMVENAALLHDVGKLAISRTLLSKPDPLTQEECVMVDQHVVFGHRLLATLPGFRRLANIVLATTEHYDGTGYPRRLAGGDIPMAARIIAMADAYDVMTAGMPVDFRRSPEAAIRELDQCSGTMFDPMVVAALRMARAAGQLRVVYPEMHWGVREPIGLQLEARHAS